MEEQVNLLKPELQKASGAKRSRLSVIIVVVLLAAELGVWGWQYYRDQGVLEQIEATEGVIEELELEIAQNQPELRESISYQARLQNLDDLLQEHVFWSEVLDELGEFTYREITYDKFLGDLVNRQITVSGKAASYRDIAKLILGLKQSQNVEAIRFQSGGASSDEVVGYDFTLEIELNPLVFRKQ